MAVPSGRECRVVIVGHPALPQGVVHQLIIDGEVSRPGVGRVIETDPNGAAALLVRGEGVVEEADGGLVESPPLCPVGGGEVPHPESEGVIRGGQVVANDEGILARRADPRCVELCEKFSRLRGRLVPDRDDPRPPIEVPRRGGDVGLVGLRGGLHLARRRQDGRGRVRPVRPLLQRGGPARKRPARSMPRAHDYEAVRRNVHQLDLNRGHAGSCLLDPGPRGPSLVDVDVEVPVHSPTRVTSDNGDRDAARGGAQVVLIAVPHLLVVSGTGRVVGFRHLVAALRVDGHVREAGPGALVARDHDDETIRSGRSDVHGEGGPRRSPRTNKCGYTRSDVARDGVCIDLRHGGVLLIDFNTILPVETRGAVYQLVPGDVITGEGPRLTLLPGNELTVAGATTPRGSVRVELQEDAAGVVGDGLVAVQVLGHPATGTWGDVGAVRVKPVDAALGLRHEPELGRAAGGQVVLELVVVVDLHREKPAGVLLPLAVGGAVRRTDGTDVEGRIAWVGDLTQQENAIRVRVDGHSKAGPGARRQGP